MGCAFSLDEEPTLYHQIVETVSVPAVRRHVRQFLNIHDVIERSPFVILAEIGDQTGHHSPVNEHVHLGDNDNCVGEGGLLVRYDNQLTSRIEYLTACAERSRTVAVMRMKSLT